MALKPEHTAPMHSVRYALRVLESIAEHRDGVTESRLSQETGLPPAGYVERVRVEAAQRGLAEGDDPVETIARRCGFGTAETLRRTFHRLVGIAPSEYRDRFRSTNVTALPHTASRPARPVHLEEISS